MDKFDKYIAFIVEIGLRTGSDGSCLYFEAIKSVIMIKDCFRLYKAGEPDFSYDDMIDMLWALSSLREHLLKGLPSETAELLPLLTLEDAGICASGEIN